MHIREASERDVPAIREVARRAWSHDYDVLTRESVEDGVEEWYGEDRLRSELRSASAVVLVAVADEDDEDVVGFAHGVWTQEQLLGTVLRVYVDPDSRREGVGTALLERIVERLEEREIETVRATVLEANDPGNDFYREAGFEHVETGTTTIGGEGYRESVYERPG